MEDHDSEKTLKELLRTTRENNQLLKKIRGYQRLGSFFRIFYWAIILGSALGLYYFLYPFLEGFIDKLEAFGDFIKDPKAFLTNTF